MINAQRTIRLTSYFACKVRIIIGNRVSGQPCLAKAFQSMNLAVTLAEGLDITSASTHLVKRSTAAMIY